MPPPGSSAEARTVPAVAAVAAALPRCHPELTAVVMAALAQPEVVRFARPARGGWLLVGATGLGLVALGGSALWAGRASLGSAPHSLELVLSGVGALLVGFAAALLSSRERAASLIIDRAAGRLLIGCRGGGEVALPLGALDGAGHGPSSTGGDQPILAVHKRDGGLIELGAVADERAADELVGTIGALIAAAREADSTPGGSAVDHRPSDPAGRFARLAGVRAERRGEALVLSWRAAMPWAALGCGGCLGGMLLIGYGVARAGRGGGAVFMALSALLLLLLLVATLVTLGRREQLTIDDRELTVSRCRFGRLRAARAVPLHSVVAVDTSHRLGTAGAALTIRTRAERERRQQAAAGLDAAAEQEEGRPLALARAVLAASQAGLSIPTGRLSLAAKVALDLTVGEEIARRRQQRAAQP